MVHFAFHRRNDSGLKIYMGRYGRRINFFVKRNIIFQPPTLPGRLTARSNTELGAVFRGICFYTGEDKQP